MSMNWNSVWLGGRSFILLAALAVALAASYYKGRNAAAEEYLAEIETIKANYAAAQLKAEQSYAAELERVNGIIQAQAAQTQAVGKELAQKQAEIGRLKAGNRENTEHAIKQDQQANGGGCIDGLGAHSLRQYKQSLGYRAD
ncbi:hypothetical protein [Neisseria perflava]|uniref:hypothetical protein n=1 Tax=Neisseria perflava TaxID=33053 RepID=UPI00209CB1C0|nr:hypothetical protein [Neisseria perflava]